MAGPEDVTGQAIVFTQIQFTFMAGNNASGILTTVLQDRQSIINVLIDMGFSNDTHYSAHARLTSNKLLLI